MKKDTLSKIIYFVINAIFSIILSNFGFIVFPENRYIGIITVFIAFILLYFSFYAFQIRKNEEKIMEMENKLETDEKLLNTIKDIVILNQVKKIR